MVSKSTGNSVEDVFYVIGFGLRYSERCADWSALLLGAVLGAVFAARLANGTLLLPALMLVVFATLERPAISDV